MLPSAPSTPVGNARQHAAASEGEAVAAAEEITPVLPNVGQKKFRGASVAELTNLAEMCILTKAEVRAILVKRFAITKPPQPATAQPTTPQPGTGLTPRSPYICVDVLVQSFLLLACAVEVEDSRYRLVLLSLVLQPFLLLSLACCLLALTTPQGVARKRKRKLLPTPAEIKREIDCAVAKKQRPGKSSPQTTNLRKLVKDPTRRRFMSQCCDPNSILWQKKKGHVKRELNKLLFTRAAQDPISELYSSYPGALHAVHNNKLLSVMRWQVPSCGC